MCVSTYVVRGMAGNQLPKPVKLTARTILFERDALIAALKRLETAGGAA
jgi:hypothetical protein